MRSEIVKPRLPLATGTPNVYVGLDDLVRLRAKARGFTFLPRQPVHSLLAGRHASRMRGRGLNFEELRNYHPGDDIRTIDWRVTARTGEPHTRVFTEERDRPALLVVDQRQTMFYGTQVAMKSYTAAMLAGLAAWRVYEQGDRVGALVFSDTDVVEIRPQRSRQTVMRILDAIVRKNQALRVGPEAEGHPGRLNEVLKAARRLAPHDAVVAVISDFDGVDDDTRRHVRQLAIHNDVLCFLVHDPSALQLPERGRLVVSDGLMQVEIDFGDRRARKQLSEFTEGRIARVVSWQHELAVPVVLIDNVRDPAEQIRKRLGWAPPARRG